MDGLTKKMDGFYGHDPLFELVKNDQARKSVRNNVLKGAEFNQAKTIIYIHFDELIISLILF